MGKIQRTFIRGFKGFDLEKFQKQELYGLLEKDIADGEVFPALRVGRIDFYYMGGCIFSYKVGGFSFNSDYFKYMGEEYTTLKQNNYLTDRTVKLETFYKDLKEGVTKKFLSSKLNKEMERQFLTPLYRSTFRSGSGTPKTIVLDIEMRFNKLNGRKCDLVLYNNPLQKLMLVEAKVVGNPEIVSKTTPKVVEQLKEYSSWLNDEETLKVQYSNYIEFINKTFKTNLNKEIKSICKPAKLIVFENVKILGEDHKQKLEAELNPENICFIDSHCIDIDNIWESLDN